MCCAVICLDASSAVSIQNVQDAIDNTASDVKNMKDVVDKTIYHVKTIEDILVKQHLAIQTAGW